MAPVKCYIIIEWPLTVFWPKPYLYLAAPAGVGSCRVCEDLPAIFNENLAYEVVTDKLWPQTTKLGATRQIEWRDHSKKDGTGCNVLCSCIHFITVAEVNGHLVWVTLVTFWFSWIVSIFLVVVGVSLGYVLVT